MSERQNLLRLLADAEENYNIAAHFVSVSYPLTENANILLRAIDKLDESLSNIMSASVRQHYISLKKGRDKKEKLTSLWFFSYGLPKIGFSKKDVKNIRKLHTLASLHKRSGFDFTLKGRAIMLLDEGTKYEVNYEDLAVFLQVMRRLLDNANRHFLDFFRKV